MNYNGQQAAPESEFLCMEPDAAEEITGFVPRHYELIQVVKYWRTEILDIAWFSYTTGCSDSITTSKGYFAEGRIRKLRFYLGNDAVDKAIREAEEEFSTVTSSKEEYDTFLRDLNDTGE